jgi:hypothetical protein
VNRGFGAALVALAIGLIAGACGDSSPSLSDVPGLTKAEFVRQANAICKEGSDQIDSEAKTFKKKHGLDVKVSLSKAQEEELVTDVVVASIQTEAEGLASLGAPQGNEHEVAAIVKGLEAMATAGEKKPASILVEGSGNTVAKVNEAAEAYGVEECKQP